MAFGKVDDKQYEEWLKKIPELSEKVVVITGTTSGTGYWASVSAIRKNAKTLILLNRSSERTKTAFKRLAEEKETSGTTTEVLEVECDLMSFDSVTKAAGQVNELCAQRGGLNVLANNAGIMAFPDKRTKDGYEVQMQTNHLSHFLLTKLLLPSFKMALDAGKEVRICQHSSKARDRSGKSLDAKYFRVCDEGTLGGDSLTENMQRYHQSKLSNSCFALALHQKLIEQGYDVTRIKSVVAEPGAPNTDLGTKVVEVNNSFLFRILSPVINFLIKVFKGVHSAADGSLCLIEACFGEEVDSGDFFYPEQVTVGVPYKAISKGQLVEGSKFPETLTLDKKNHQLVWEKSEEALGSFF